ncbi:kinase-like protein [Hygrophoropsis aurantiaca]|uniref:Kinase-like protein n=1 Tax=Hygrophoropsis aurantiaca TaxID=72124 RepID=A0ACB8AN47_9AGAM|nr:kinase-like protein [Hygrophoropsis aurantiaca]
MVHSSCSQFFASNHSRDIIRCVLERSPLQKDIPYWWRILCGYFMRRQSVRFSRNPSSCSFAMPSSNEWDHDSSSSSTSSSSSSVDEDDIINARVAPDWTIYRRFIEQRGYRLDTVRDVKDYYQRHCVGPARQHIDQYLPGYGRACAGLDDDALCRDAGLRENLFRASRSCDGAKVMIKAVHIRSREIGIVRYLSSPLVRCDPMNHCIPILDLIDVPEDDLSFVVMEEWSPHLFAEIPCCRRQFLRALEQCIEHVAFMHRHQIVHFDISLHNFLTDYNGNYACIDYELSRSYIGVPNPRIFFSRGTELPPEFEGGQSCDPYKVDIWALAILILRASKLVEFHIPELIHLTIPMLSNHPDKRPSAALVLKEFRRLVPVMEPELALYDVAS